MLQRTPMYILMKEVSDTDFIDKIVYFEQYCPTCKSAECAQDEEPCNECLGQAVNEYSHKPINYTPDKKKGGK